MRSVVRDFTYVSCLFALALLFALAWGSPFVQANSSYAPNEAQLQQPAQ
jgi:hypothetical protein